MEALKLRNGYLQPDYDPNEKDDFKSYLIVISVIFSLYAIINIFVL